MVDAVRTAPGIQLRSTLLCVCIAPRLLFSRLKACDLVLDRLPVVDSIRVLRDLRGVHLSAAVRLPESGGFVARPRIHLRELLLPRSQRLPPDSCRTTDFTVCHQFPTFRFILGKIIY